LHPVGFFFMNCTMMDGSTNIKLIVYHLLNMQHYNSNNFQTFLENIMLLYSTLVWRRHGPGIIVGIATGYGLDSPGIESRWGRDFLHLSRPALGPTQPPV
jgi:hypothetical protein